MPTRPTTPEQTPHQTNLRAFKQLLIVSARDKKIEDVLSFVGEHRLLAETQTECLVKLHL
jgi:hypothetical protein